MQELFGIMDNRIAEKREHRTSRVEVFPEEYYDKRLSGCGQAI
ncbi:hypothetical protein [Rhizobium sp. SYY.PMSO]